MYLALLAFERALARRRAGAGLLVHTDRGCQYVAQDFLNQLCDHHVTLSMSRKGNCWGDAVAERFFHSLKVELVHGEQFRSRWQLEREVFEYIEMYFNRNGATQRLTTCRRRSTRDRINLRLGSLPDTQRNWSEITD